MCKFTKNLFSLLALFLLFISSTFAQSYNQSETKEKINSAVNIFEKDQTAAFKLIQESINEADKANDRITLIDAYYTLSLFIFKKGEAEEAIIPANQALINALELGREVLAAPIYELLSKIYIAKDLKLESLEYLYKGYNLSKELRDSSKISWYLLQISEVEQEIGNVSNAMKMALMSKEFFESTHDSINLSKSFYTLALIHIDLGNYPSAESNLNKSSTLFKHFNDSIMLGVSYSSLSRLFLYNSRPAKSFEFAQKASEILRNRSKKEYLRNQELISEIYFSQNRGSTALSILQGTIDGQLKIKDLSGLASSYLLLGDILKADDQLNAAEDAYKLSITNSKEVGLYKLIRQSFNGLSDIAAKTGKSRDAYDFLIQYVDITDSLYNLQNISEANRLENELELQKKEQEIVKKEAQLTVNAQRMKVERQRQVLLFVIIILFIAFIILVSRDYRRKKKNTVELEIQKKVIEEQKSIAEKRNRDITDSLNYARRIQQAILRASIKLEEVFHESFILFVPKDIVSGDFYWVKKMDKQILFAVADCTGHGAPGAFMSIIGTYGLNKFVSELNITNPGEILNNLNNFFRTSFEQQEGSEIFDGMDVGICSYNPNTKELSYSGANIPIHILRNSNKPSATAHITFKDDVNTLYQAMPDKQSIGYSFDEIEFKTHSIQLLEGDQLFLFSDGFADQIGGHDGKKFRIQELRKLICSIANRSSIEQKQILEKIYKDWKGSFLQVDDMSFMGIKIISY